MAKTVFNIPFHQVRSQRLFLGCTRHVIVINFRRNDIGANFCTFSIFGQPSSSTSCSVPLLNILALGSMFIATSRKALSRNGTRASKPHAIVDLVKNSCQTARITDENYTLIRTKTVGCVQVFYATHALLVERDGVGSGMEVKVS